MRRIFTLDDQLNFAKLSGDYNPLHINPIAARRLMFGRPVVHGIHGFLWAVDTLLAAQTTPVSLRSVSAEFHRAMCVGDELVYSIESEGAQQAELLLSVKGETAAVIELKWSEGQTDSSGYFSPENPPKNDCKEINITQAAQASGKFELHLNAEAEAALFPNIARCLPPVQIAEILATTRLVGMECPGLHSIFSELNLKFQNQAAEVAPFAYEVTDCDERFSLINLKVTAPFMQGTIGAFLRPAPKAQVNFKSLSSEVKAGEFAGQKALIVGGSRGLGEVTAKLLAAGGAEVKITYAVGSEDAGRVVEEINENGGSAGLLHLNVLEVPEDLAERLGGGWSPTHLYYYATSYIAIGAKGVFSPDIFRQFSDYYIGGFVKTFQALQNIDLSLQKIFYPSSVFVDERPSNMGEYAASKMAAELVCTYLEEDTPELVIHKPRLPKFATDQTLSLLPTNALEPLPVILEHLRLLRDA